MDCSLIIGAVIGLVCTSLGTYLSYLLNLSNIKRKRVWELEDYTRNLENEIISQRLEQIESFVTCMSKIAAHFFDPYMLGILLENESSRKERTKMINEFFDNYYLISLLDYFDDKELTTSFTSACSQILSLLDLQDEQLDIVESGQPIKKDDYSRKIKKIPIFKSISKVIKRIDEIKLIYKIV